MEAANRGHATAYGDDPWTARAADAFRELFETDCEVFFVFNGTAANSLALASLCQSYHGVICCDSAHVETDECGAPEFFSNGSKLLVAPSADGKLTPGAIRELATKRQDIHYPKPRVVTITQSTETGPRLHAGGAARHLRGLQGAWALSAHGRRALRQRLRQPGLHAGRNDLEERRGRALLRRHQERHGRRRSGAVLRPQAGRRFRLPLQAGRAARVEDALPGRAVGGHAGERRLAAQRRSTPTAAPGTLRSKSPAFPASASLAPVEANAVFLSRLRRRCSIKLRARGWKFYTFIGGAARIMFAWDTDPARVDAFCRDLKECAGRARASKRHCTPLFRRCHPERRSPQATGVEGFAVAFREVTLEWAPGVRAIAIGIFLPREQVEFSFRNCSSVNVTVNYWVQAGGAALGSGSTTAGGCPRVSILRPGRPQEPIRGFLMIRVPELEVFLALQIISTVCATLNTDQPSLSGQWKHRMRQEPTANRPRMSRNSFAV